MKLVFTKAAQGKLKKLGIAAVYLIGSRARGTARINSDFDFAVLLKNPKKSLQHEAALRDKLTDIFFAALPHVKIKLPYPENIIHVDIVFLQSSPLYYSMAARNEGKVLFEERKGFCRAFEEHATLEYADFEPFRKEQERATLAMI